MKTADVSLSCFISLAIIHTLTCKVKVNQQSHLMLQCSLGCRDIQRRGRKKAKLRVKWNWTGVGGRRVCMCVCVCPRGGSPWSAVTDDSVTLKALWHFARSAICCCLPAAQCKRSFQFKAADMIFIIYLWQQTSLTTTARSHKFSQWWCFTFFYFDTKLTLVEGKSKRGAYSLSRVWMGANVLLPNTRES